MIIKVFLSLLMLCFSSSSPTLSGTTSKECGVALPREGSSWRKWCALQLHWCGGGGIGRRFTSFGITLPIPLHKIIQHHRPWNQNEKKKRNVTNAYNHWSRKKVLCSQSFSHLKYDFKLITCKWNVYIGCKIVLVGWGKVYRVNNYDRW